MSKYQINAAAVDFIIKSCADCYNSLSEAQRTDINILRDKGWPICDVCGMDLDVEPVAEIRLDCGLALLSRKEMGVVLDHLKLKSTRDGSNYWATRAAHQLWVNTQTREELIVAGFLEKP